jgi:hypothetical protein
MFIIPVKSAVSVHKHINLNEGNDLKLNIKVIFPMVNSLVLRNEDVWGSGGITPKFLTSVLD